MININLLPQFRMLSIQWLIFIVIFPVIIIFLHQQCKVSIIEKQQKIALLKKEIQTLDADIASPKKNNSVFVIPVDNQHIPLLSTLKRLPHTLPVGLYLTEISMVKNRLKLIGHAEKTEILSTWASRLTASHFNVAVQEITQNNEALDFAVKFFLYLL